MSKASSELRGVLRGLQEAVVTVIDHQKNMEETPDVIE